MRISDWSSDVCSSDLRDDSPLDAVDETGEIAELGRRRRQLRPTRQSQRLALVEALDLGERVDLGLDQVGDAREHRRPLGGHHRRPRSEEHTSELQSLMRISYAVFCLKKKTRTADSKQEEQKPALKTMIQPSAYISLTHNNTQHAD